MPLGDMILSPTGNVLLDSITGNVILESICPDFRPYQYIVTLAGTAFCPGCIADGGVSSLQWETALGLQSFDLTFMVDNGSAIGSCCVPWTRTINTALSPYNGPYLRQYFPTDLTCSGVIAFYIVIWSITLTRTVNSARLSIVGTDNFGNTIVAFDGTAATMDCGSVVTINNSLACGGFNLIVGGSATVTAIPC